MMLPVHGLQASDFIVTENGMPTAFRSDAANFTRMSDSKPLWIDSVVHKTYLRVDEKGTEAAAVTSVQTAGSAAPVSPPFQMTVDRPYLMALVDNDSGAILFLAAVRDPRGGVLDLLIRDFAEVEIGYGGRLDDDIGAG